MTGIVFLTVLVVTVLVGLQLTHRRRDVLFVPGYDPREDADHRRLVAELRAAPTACRPHREELGRQELVRLAA